MPAATSHSVRFRTAVTLAAAAAVILATIVAAWFVLRGPHDEFASLNGHKGGAYSLALSPDGTKAATGGGEGAIRIWDVARQRQKAVLTGHVGRVLALAWSPDGGTLASGGDDRSVRLWDATSGETRGVREKLPQHVLGLAYSSDGKLLAAAVERDVYVWEGDLSAEPRILRGHRLYISGLTFIPGSHELATFGTDRTVRFWDADTNKEIAKMPGPTGHCHGLALSADGKTLACIGGGRIHLFDLERRTATETIEPHARTLYGIAFSPDKRLVALGSEDKVVVIWDLTAKKERSRLRGHGYAVGPMAFLPDGRTLVTAGYDSKIKLWHVQ